MEKSEYLNKLHSDILVIMDYVDEICKKNNLNYYLIGGSLLGAVRHNGFIPWDDDLDIVMPRNDFNKFVKICKNSLREDFYFRWVTTEDSYWQLFAKMCLRHTFFQEPAVDADKVGGIFVDIFPLDSCNGYDLKMKLLKPLVSLNKIWLFKQIKGRRIFTSSFIHSSFLFLVSQLRNKSNTYYAMFGASYPIWKVTFKKDWFGCGIKMDFSGRQYMGPSNSHEILKLTFGDDYMTLPPEDKRITHMPLKVIFKDGSEYISNY